MSNSQRNNLINEIIDSEIKYRQFLSHIKHKFRPAILSCENVCTEDCNIIFSHLDSIYQLSGTLIRHIRLQDDCMGRTFLRFMPYFKCYIPYICKHGATIHVLSKLMQNPNGPAEIIKTIENEVEINMKFDALLIMPIQRIPRYELLLTQLYELTDSTHSDYPFLSKAVKQIKELANEINSKLEEQQKMDYLQKLSSRIQNRNAVQFIHPGRQFVQDGQLLRVDIGLKRLEQVFVIVLTDIIVVCVPVYRLSQILHLPSTLSSNSSCNINRETIDNSRLKCINVISMEEVRVRSVRRDKSILSSWSNNRHSVDLDQRDSSNVSVNLPWLEEEDKPWWVLRTNRGGSHSMSLRPLSACNSNWINVHKYTTDLFQICTRNETILFACNDSDTCNSWISVIQNAAFEYRQRRNSLKLDMVIERQISLKRKLSNDNNSTVCGKSTRTFPTDTESPILPIRPTNSCIVKDSILTSTSHRKHGKKHISKTKKCVIM